MRLIDADGLLPMMKYATTDSEIGIFPVKIGFNEIAKVIDNAPTVDAIPVELIQKRIEYLRELANYAFDTNGGYVEYTHMRLYELEELLEMWAERRTDE